MPLSMILLNVIPDWASPTRKAQNRKSTANNRIRRPSAGYALPSGHPYRGGGYRLTLALPGLRAPAHRAHQPKPLALTGLGSWFSLRLACVARFLLCRERNNDLVASALTASRHAAAVGKCGQTVGRACATRSVVHPLSMVCPHGVAQRHVHR